MIPIDGFLIPILVDASEEGYQIFTEKAVPIFKDPCCARVVGGMADDVPHGSPPKSHSPSLGGRVVFARIEWLDKATRDAGKKAMEGLRMPPRGELIPRDGPHDLWRLLRHRRSTISRTSGERR